MTAYTQWQRGMTNSLHVREQSEYFMLE